MNPLKSALAGAATIVATLVVSPAVAQPVAIAWSQYYNHHYTADPLNAVGPPDNATTPLSEHHYVWLQPFKEDGALYDLAEALGVDSYIVSLADIIAFESNGGAPACSSTTRGWEGSTWFFTDEANAYAETFDPTAGIGTASWSGRAEFFTGDIESTPYEAFFGAPPDPGRPLGTEWHMGWILVNVPDEIDVHSARFSVWVSGAQVYEYGARVSGCAYEGAPEIDALGVIVH